MPLEDTPEADFRLSVSRMRSPRDDRAKRLSGSWKLIVEGSPQGGAKAPAARGPRVAYTGHVAGQRGVSRGPRLYTYPAKTEEGPWTHRHPETPAHGRAPPGT